MYQWMILIFSPSLFVSNRNFCKLEKKPCINPGIDSSNRHDMWIFRFFCFARIYSLFFFAALYSIIITVNHEVCKRTIAEWLNEWVKIICMQYSELIQLLLLLQLCHCSLSLQFWTMNGDGAIVVVVVKIIYGRETKLKLSIGVIHCSIAVMEPLVSH